MPKRKLAARNSIKNLGGKAPPLPSHPSPPPEASEATLEMTEDDGEEEYVGYVSDGEPWGPDEILELTNQDVNQEEAKAKAGVWNMLFAGYQEWEKRKKAEKEESARPNRPRQYLKNSAKTLERKRKLGEEHGNQLSFGPVSTFIHVGD